MTAEQISNQVNTMCAMTDLFMGIVVLILIFILNKYKTDRTKLKACWMRTFVAIDASCFLGFTVHFCFPTGIMHQIIWVVLYPLLMENVILFDLTAMCRLTEERKPEKRDYVLLHTVGASSVAVALLLYHIFGVSNPIALLTAFAAAIVICGFAVFARIAFKSEGKGERIMFLSFIPMLIGAYFEVRQTLLVKVIWYFDYDSVLHMCAAVGIVIMFFGILKSLGNNSKTKSYD